MRYGIGETKQEEGLDMRKNMMKKPIVLVVAVIMLFTFATASQAHAFFPAVGWAIWGVGVGLGTLFVVKNEHDKMGEAKKEQNKSTAQNHKKASQGQLSTLELQRTPG
jgi:flagellar biosynthesis component FlhA